MVIPQLVQHATHHFIESVSFFVTTLRAERFGAAAEVTGPVIRHAPQSPFGVGPEPRTTRSRAALFEMSCDPLDRGHVKDRHRLPAGDDRGGRPELDWLTAPEATQGRGGDVERVGDFMAQVVLTG